MISIKEYKRILKNISVNINRELFDVYKNSFTKVQKKTHKKKRINKKYLKRYGYLSIFKHYNIPY
jgi:putative alpha-1,2-mannosidase